ncbi:hypothetical protein CDAR_172261 [Caerostris darwini]|uniref:Uncharacterized protein n=1 Tax=Caerostris darwini TaxID=1538125 RepID=A0AAV4U3I3_9ARAC|nr:hypothetical protein CDAR_172261 [Caerostris darwini]
MTAHPQSLFISGKTSHFSRSRLECLPEGVGGPFRELQQERGLSDDTGKKKFPSNWITRNIGLSLANQQELGSSRSEGGRDSSFRIWTPSNHGAPFLRKEEPG